MTCECRSDDIPEYSLDEVSQHYNEKSCWIVYLDKVYDISSFMVEHPGGFEILLEHAGNDATNAFQEAGHSKKARKILAKYFIGNLIKKDRMYQKDLDKGCPLCFSTLIKDDLNTSTDAVSSSMSQ